MRRNNPFYLVSALLMLCGTYMWLEPFSIMGGDLKRLGLHYILLQVYEFCLVLAFMYLLRGKGLVSDGYQLLFIESLFLLDAVTISAEFSSISLKLGLVMNTLTLVLVIIKLTLIIVALQMTISRLFITLLSTGFFFIHSFVWLVVYFRSFFEQSFILWVLSSFFIVIQVHLLSSWCRTSQPVRTFLERTFGRESRKVLLLFIFLQILFSLKHMFALGYIFNFPINFSWFTPLILSMIVLCGPDRYLRQIYIKIRMEPHPLKPAYTSCSKSLEIDSMLHSFSFVYSRQMISSQSLKIPQKSIQQKLIHLGLPLFITGILFALLQAPDRYVLPLFSIELSPLRIALLYGAILLFTYGIKNLRKTDVCVALISVVLALGGAYPQEILSNLIQPTGLYLTLILFLSVYIAVNFKSFIILAAMSIYYGIIISQAAWSQNVFSGAQIVHLVLYSLLLISYKLKEKQNQRTLLYLLAMILELHQLAVPVSSLSYFRWIDYGMIILASMIWGNKWLNISIRGLQ
ncbi:hypothetical protein ACFL27_20930, partial [candidate division CSSED10-310 bacterium]